MVKKEDSVKLLTVRIEAALQKFLYETRPDLLKSQRACLGAERRVLTRCVSMTPPAAPLGG
jgi:hypothetical protein